MSKEYLQDRILKILEKKVPSKKDLVKLLYEILPIEKEAIYRRLRGEVAFSLDEVAIIARSFNISIDQLIEYSGKTLGHRSYIYPELVVGDNSGNYKTLVKYVDKIRQISEKPSSEHVHTVHMIPIELVLGYPHVLKFLSYQYFHLYGDSGKLGTFETFILPDEIRRELKKMEKYLKNISSTCYIWGPLVILSLVDNMQYFIYLRMISRENVDLFKKDLLQLLSDLEMAAIKGTFKNTENRFSFYISNLHVNSTKGYLCAEDEFLSIFSTFVIQVQTYMDADSYKDTKSRIQSLKKASTLISLVGEKDRIRFFQAQKELVESL